MPHGNGSMTGSAANVDGQVHQRMSVGGAAHHRRPGR